MREKPFILVYPRDMLSSTAITAAAQKVGVRALVDVPPDVVESTPQVVVVEMGSITESRWQDRLRAVRERWPSVPVLAFGPHVDTAARRRARHLGATQVLSRHRFHHEWPQMLAAYTASQEDPTGCRDRPSPVALEGLALFDRGAYYECHELLEEAWRAEPRPCRDLYQGVLQFGIAMYHIRRGHYAGAMKMLRRAEHNLRNVPALCLGIDVARLRAALQEVRDTLQALGPERIHEFPETLFPRIPYHVAS